MRQAPDKAVLEAMAAEIKARRASLEVSQEELAHRAGVNRSFIAKLEVAKNQPSLSVVFRLAEALEVAAQDLVAGIAQRYKKSARHNKSSGISK